jgi:Zn-dependent metalloprotease
VEGPLRRSLSYFNGHKEKFGLQEADADLRLLAAEEDDVGLTHVRLEQVHHGVEVFGGQLISHLDADSVRDISGRAFEVQIGTTPTLDSEQAIEAARAALSLAGELASPPSAKLVILPHRIFTQEETSDATLVYQVELKIEDGTEATADHQYFVNAQDGSIVWHAQNKLKLRYNLG